MIDDQMHDVLFAEYVETKRNCFADGLDCPFIVNYAVKADIVYTVLLPDRGVLASALASLLVQYGGPEWLSIMADVWTRKAGSLDELLAHDEIDSTDLEEQFTAGDMDVAEALVMVVVEDEHNVRAEQINYHVADTGELEFKRVNVGTYDGSIVRILHKMMSFRGCKLEDVMIKLMRMFE